MNLKYLEEAFSLSTPVVTVTEAFPGSWESTESPWCGLYYKRKERSAFGYLDLPFVCNNEFGDPFYETFYSLRKNKENDAGQWVLASLNKLTKGRDELHDRINQLPAYQNMVKDNNEFSDKIDVLHIYIKSVKGSKCALEKNLLSSSHRVQVVENQTEALIRLAEL